MGTELSAKKTTESIGSLAVPVLIYSFGIISLCQEEQQNPARKSTQGHT